MREKIAIKKESPKAQLMAMLKDKGLSAKSIGRNAITAAVDVENIIGGYKGKIVILIDDMGFVGIHHLKTEIPHKSRGLVSEYYLRINSILKRGVIGLDLENGETRFRYAMSKLDFDKEPEGELSWFLRMPVIVMARFLPSLKDVVARRLSPKCVFEKCIADLN